MKIVEVIWIDISFLGGWNSQNKVDKFITDDSNRKVTQVAYLYEEDENQLVLVDSFIGKEFGTVHTIPKGCIQSVRVIS